MDGLDLQPARRLQRLREQPARAAQRIGIGRTRADRVSFSRSARRPASSAHSPSRANSRDAISAAAALV